MQPAPASVCLATLGSQPQVVTLALDRLLAQGANIVEVIVVHLSLQNQRYRTALECLTREFAGECYAGRRCHYRPFPIQIGSQAIDDLDNDMATDAVLNDFHRLIQMLKRQELLIHLCPTGGRRLLGMLALAAALLHFDQHDRIWHLYSSDAVRRQTDRGALLHLPDTPEVQLLRVPVPPWGHLFPALRTGPDQSAGAVLELQTRALDASERVRCQRVVDRISPRQRDVLAAFAAGCTPQEVAERLSITLATVNAHKTPIFQECCNVWDLPPDTRLDYRWLREKFAEFFK